MGRSAAKNLPDPEAWPTVYYRSRKKRQSSRMKPSGFRLDVADKSEIFERHNSRGHSPPMPTEIKKEIALEIAHVLFIDIVGYSKLSINEQSEALQELNQIVRNTESARAADAAKAL